MYFEPPVEEYINTYSGALRYNLRDPILLTRVSLVDYEYLLETIFEELLDDAVRLAGLDESDRVLVRLTPGLDEVHGTEIYISTRMIKVGEINAEHIMEAIDRLLQSFENLQLSDLQVVVIWSKNFEVGSYYNTQTSVEDFIKNKKCIIRITNESFCFWQCLILALYPEERSRFTKNKKTLFNTAKQFAIDRNFPESVTLDMLGDIAKLFQTTVLVIGCESLEFIKRCEVKNAVNTLILFYVPGESKSHFHYVVTDKVNALFERNNFCWNCYVPFFGGKNAYHSCIKTCKGCKQPSCEGTSMRLQDFKLACENCGILCVSDKCKSTHKANELCKLAYICYKCKLYIRRGEEHVCGYRKCPNCKELVEVSEDVSDNHHLCFMQPYEALEEKNDKLIFFDYETYLNINKEHEVALVVAVYSHDNTPHIFHDNDTFITWLFSKKHKGYTVISHNGGKFDNHFIKKEMINRRISSSDISNGRNIFYMKTKASASNLRFIDSIKFIPLPLRSFPKTFGFDCHVKGHFPYTFLTRETLNYVGDVPDISFFGFESLKVSEFEGAVKWYNDRKWQDENGNYDMQQQLRLYCESDVYVLKEGCMRFSNIILEVTENQVCPWNFITIASVCMAIYRCMDLPLDTIAKLRNDNCVIEAYNWGCFKITQQLGEELCWWEFVPDKLCWINGDRSLFFFACLDTGCSRCYRSSTQHPTLLMSMSQLYYRNERRIQGCDNYECTRQCEWAKLKKHKKMKDYPGAPLRIRDGFFGGRTEVFSLYENVGFSSDRIEYVDFTSLYPSVCSGRYRDPVSSDNDQLCFNYFPVGHPVRIYCSVEDFMQKEYFGFVKCRISSPAGIIIPLLPVRANGKLMFPVLDAVDGTWTTAEVYEATRFGYIIHEIYNVLHFPNKSCDLFFPYVKRFMKLKIIAGKWGKTGCETDEEKLDFIRNTNSVWGIDVSLEDMEGDYNPGMYYISKLALNSHWGKFAQRGDHTETIDTFTNEKFTKYCHSDIYDVVGVFLHNNSARTISYKDLSSANKDPRNTNIAIASYVTAYARLRLYKLLNVLGKRALYCDTDSVIYRHSGIPDFQPGPYLGDLTSELEKDDYIIEFASTGPKSYAYKTLQGKEDCKCKGFRLSAENSKSIHLESMKLMIEFNDVIETRDMQFTVAQSHEVKTLYVKKNYSFTFDKRYILEKDIDGCIHTLPYTMTQNLETTFVDSFH